MKTDLFQSYGHCWFFQICWHIECSTFTASSFRIWNTSTGIPSPPLAFFVVTLPKAHLTSYSRMSGSRWVITPLWLSGLWRSFLYSSSVYSCHLFLISSASVRSIQFLSWIFIGRSDAEAEASILLMRGTDSFEKTLMLRKIEGERRRGRQRMRWLDGITDLTDMSLSNSRSWWWTGRPGVLWSMGSQRVGHDWATELNWTCVVFSYYLTNYTIYLRRWFALPLFLLHYLFRVNWSALSIYLPLWVKTLSSKRGLHSVKSLYKRCSTRGEIATHSSIVAWRSSLTVWKGKKIWHQKMIPQDQKVSNMLQRKFSSVTQSCPTLCDPMDDRMTGFPVYHQLPEFVQTHVHQVGDVIQPPHPLSSPSPPAFNLSQHQGLFKWVSFSHQVAKTFEFQHQTFQWIFRTDCLSDWLVW